MSASRSSQSESALPARFQRRCSSSRGEMRLRSWRVSRSTRLWTSLHRTLPWVLPQKKNSGFISEGLLWIQTLTELPQKPTMLSLSSKRWQPMSCSICCRPLRHSRKQCPASVSSISSSSASGVTSSMKTCAVTRLEQARCPASRTTSELTRLGARLRASTSCSQRSSCSSSSNTSWQQRWQGEVLSKGSLLLPMNQRRLTILQELQSMEIRHLPVCPPFLSQAELPRAPHLSRANQPLLQDAPFAKDKAPSEVEKARVVLKYHYCIERQAEPESYLLHLSPNTPFEELQPRLPFIEERQFQLLLDFERSTVQVVNESLSEIYRTVMESKIALLVSQFGLFNALRELQNRFEHTVPSRDQVYLHVPKAGGQQNKEGAGQPKQAQVQDQAQESAQELAQEQVHEQEQEYKQQEQRVLVHAGQSSDEQEEDRLDNRLADSEDNPRVELRQCIQVHSYDTNFLAFQLSRLALRAHCRVCKLVELFVVNKHTTAFTCKACHSPHKIFIKRSIIVRAKPLVCLFGSEGLFCHPVALAFNVLCECGIANRADDQLFGQSVAKLYRCFKCFKSIKLAYEGLYISDIGERPDVLKRMVFKEGRPLPDNGSCAHSSRTFRLLRYPCCKGAFSCDRCHELHSEKHEWQTAIGMICGFCSKEQRTGGCCSGCGQFVDQSKEKSNNWEGGKGCRVKQQMNRNEKKKHTGEGKTLSRRAKQKQQRELEESEVKGRGERGSLHS